ncbi:acyl-protein synthetase [Chlorobaculum sp. 24CR]|uniref:addiction module protein n=1 Tax=Chlorobaculum sp. 24CR TaxID=2508878 RepID=UPI00100B6D13|nr:addiction module protein [Chlorobaculum sp. 24CR]RXK88363.1 acyl-protein synthetase [Chlorobaculum sp. 24CR]
MNLLQTIDKLPRVEKIKVMEFIWKQLTTKDSEFESPAWHKDALAETESRYESGKEELIDWSEAKELLRKQFQ